MGMLAMILSPNKSFPDVAILISKTNRSIARKPDALEQRVLDRLGPPATR